MVTSDPRHSIANRDIYSPSCERISPDPDLTPTSQLHGGSQGNTGAYAPPESGPVPLGAPITTGSVEQSQVTGGKEQPAQSYRRTVHG